MWLQRAGDRQRTLHSCTGLLTWLLCSRAQELFKLKHYNDLDGGILEGFGRLLKFNLKIYVYPTLDTKTGEVITAANLKVGRRSPPTSHLEIAGWSEPHLGGA